jgi:hypothetical protein
MDLFPASTSRRLRCNHYRRGSGDLEPPFFALKQLLAEGVLVLAGPTLGRVNTGIVVFEAPDEDSARAIMNGDPVVSGGYAEGELRPFQISLLRAMRPA